MLRKVVKITFYQPTDRRACYNYKCYYTANKSGWRGDRRRVYTWKDNLPATVLDMVLNGVNTRTEYRTDITGLPVKYETFERKVNGNEDQ